MESTTEADRELTNRPFSRPSFNVRSSVNPSVRNDWSSYPAAKATKGVAITEFGRIGAGGASRAGAERNRCLSIVVPTR